MGTCDNLLLSCHGLTMAYGDRPVVQDLSFDVRDGEYLCIVGENGAGKSTLLKGILGLKQSKSGTIEWGCGLSRTQMGYLPQQTAIQRDFPASVYEVVLSGCLNSSGMRPWYTRRQKSHAEKTMDSLGIANLTGVSYRSLSGGQQQRVLLARALCATDRLLLLDEPVTGLDPMMTTELYRSIAHLNADLGITVIMVSHDIGAAVSEATKILHLNREHTFFGTVREYRESDLGRRFMGEGSR